MKLLLAFILLLSACTPQQNVNLARYGSISRATGADVPLSLCGRLAHVASSVAGYNPDIRRAGSICGAARGL